MVPLHHVAHTISGSGNHLYLPKFTEKTGYKVVHSPNYKLRRIFVSKRDGYRVNVLDERDPSYKNTHGNVGVPTAGYRVNCNAVSPDFFIKYEATNFVKIYFYDSLYVPPNQLFVSLRQPR